MPKEELFCLFVYFTASLASTTSPLPHIIFIVADDLGNVHTTLLLIINQYFNSYHP